MLWYKKYTQSSFDVFNSIQQTSDSGYIAAGSAFEPLNFFDLHVLKADANGNIQWQKRYSNGQIGFAHSIKETTDRGYIVGGITFFPNSSREKFWVLRLDPDGGIGSSCSIIRPANAVVGTSNVISENSSATVSDVGIKVTAISLIPNTSTITTTTQCVSP